MNIYSKQNVFTNEVHKVCTENSPLFFDNKIVASWNWNITTDTFFYGTGFESLLGYPSDFLNSSKVSMTSLICVDDIERIILSIDEAIYQKLQFWNNSYRILKADGTFASVNSNGFIFCDENSPIIKMKGFSHKDAYAVG